MLGVKDKVELKSSIPVGAIIEISPQRLYTRSQQDFFGLDS